MFSSSVGQLTSLFFLLGVVGCGGSTIRVTPTKFTGAAPPTNGAVYFLPKSLLLVKLNVAVTPATKPTCGTGAATDCNLEVSDFSVRDLAIEALSVPDTANAFLMETSGGSFLVKTEFTAAFNDRGELSSSTSKSTSQAVQLATTGLEALAKVVGVVAMAGPSASGREALAKEARRLEGAITAIDKKLDTNWPLLNQAPVVAPPGPAKATPKPALSPKVADVVDEVSDLLELRSKLAKLLDEVRGKLKQEEIVLPVACVVDPSSGTSFDVGTNCAAYQAVATGLTGANITLNAALPSLKLTLAHQGGPAAASASAPNETVTGFYYRVPAWFEAEAVAGNARVRTSLPIPQRGQLALWQLDEDDLRSGKTIAIELHPGLGSVKSVTLNADPVSADDLKALATAAKGITTAPDDAEVDALKRETAKLDAERGVLEAKQKLEDAKKPKKDEEPSETK